MSNAYNLRWTPARAKTSRASFRAAKSNGRGVFGRAIKSVVRAGVKTYKWAKSKYGRRKSSKSDSNARPVMLVNDTRQYITKYAGRKALQYASKSKRNKLYSSVLKYGMTEEKTRQIQGSSNISQIGNNDQALCQWYGFSAWSPSQYDSCIGSSAETATGTSSGISSYQEFFKESARLDLQLKCSSNRSCQITIWECVPRKDISAQPGLTVTGLNPTLLQQGFSDMGLFGAAQSALAYNQYNASPFDSGQWCRMFKLKRVVQKVLEPGQMYEVVYMDKRKGIVDKAKYGVKSSDTLANAYTFLRDCGSVFLVRVQGTPSHNENLVTLPYTSNAGSVTESGFSLDWVTVTKQEIRVPWFLPTRETGNFSALLPTFTGSIEYSYITIAPSDQPDTT